MKLLPLNKLQPDEICDLYGHTYSEEEILSLYPCDKGVFHKEDYDTPDMTITYDVHTAYNLRMKNIPFVVWGKEYKSYRAFVFRKPRPKATLF